MNKIKIKLLVRKNSAIQEITTIEIGRNYTAETNIRIKDLACFNDEAVLCLEAVGEEEEEDV